ncbi:MAG: Rrf2 family transcriptional regulator [Bryobacteraceae bacterium]|nr:Rrf2 family transcriptional regulator [Bryobacteraceae bacterium]
MRTLSKKTQYCLRALYALARHYGHGPVLIQKLSEEEAIPKKFLELILLDLKGRGVVASKKGKGGGYFLVRPPDRITVGSVIRLIDGPLAPLPCASETAFRKCDECHDEKICGTRIVMKEVRDAIAHILDHTTLADVCQKVDTAKDRSELADALIYEI